MKRGSVCAMLFLAAVLIMGLHIGTAGAQGVPADLVQWEGSEWQITMTSKGYEFDPIDAAPSGKIRGTVKFWGVMTIVRVSEIDPTPTGEIQITLYEPKKGECVPSTVINGLALNYVAGSGLSFAAEGVDLMGVFYFTGKENASGLKGKVETLGAYQAAGNPFEAFGINLKGTTKALGCTIAS